MDQHADHDVAALEREVEALRQRTQAVALTLEERLRLRRRQARHLAGEVRQLFDVERQLRAHPLVAGGVLLAAAAAAAVAIGMSLARRRREQRWPRRLRRRLEAYGAIAADPEAALRPRDPLLQRLTGAAAVAVAGTMARALGERLVPPAER